MLDLEADFYVADCETNPFDSVSVITPFVWGLSDGLTTEVFYDTDEFLVRLDEVGGVCYAHNGGRFDWLLVSDAIDAHSKISIIASRLAKANIGNCEIRDSINILPVPLSAFKKDDIDYNIFAPGVRDKPHNKKKIKDYLVSDCIYLHTLISKFRQGYGGGLTLAGAAMKVWEKMNGKEDRLGEDFYREFSKYYVGGRVECFRKGLIDTPFKVIDINSAYPFAMTHDMPHGEARAYLDNLEGLTDAEISRSFITVECDGGGILAHRDEKGAVTYPRGTVNVFYTSGWEYLAGIRCGVLRHIKIIEVVCFVETVNFKPYIDNFFAKKVAAQKAGDKADTLISKLFLNALYGKFASCPDRYSDFVICDTTDMAGYIDAGYRFGGEFGNRVLMKKTIADREKENGYYNVAVAASITGFVRAYLYEAMHKCKDVLYCDTDSIACKDTGDLVLHPTDLGAWDLEAECTGGGIGGKKLYAFKKLNGQYKTASKGTRLTPKEILRVCAGEVVKYRPVAPTLSVRDKSQKYVSRDVRIT